MREAVPAPLANSLPNPSPSWGRCKDPSQTHASCRKIPLCPKPWHSFWNPVPLDPSQFCCRSRVKLGVTVSHDEMTTKLPLNCCSVR
jgi:hypothetical protein